MLYMLSIVVAHIKMQFSPRIITRQDLPKGRREGMRIQARMRTYACTSDRHAGTWPLQAWPSALYSIGHQPARGHN
jgi:hypothetical protein